VRTEYTPPNIIYRHISVYVSVPAAVSGGYRSAHCTQASFLYIPIYRYTMAAVSGGAYACTLHTSLLPLPVICRYICRYIHCAQASFLPHTDISIFFSLSFFRLNPCRPRSRDSRVRFHTHTHTTHFDLYFFVGC
jgi:hypothetical protein